MNYNRSYPNQQQVNINIVDWNITLYLPISHHLGSSYWRSNLQLLGWAGPIGQLHILTPFFCRSLCRLFSFGNPLSYILIFYNHTFTFHRIDNSKKIYPPCPTYSILLYFSSTLMCGSFHISYILSIFFFWSFWSFFIFNCLFWP